MRCLTSLAHYVPPEVLDGPPRPRLGLRHRHIDERPHPLVDRGLFVIREQPPSAEPLLEQRYRIALLPSLDLLLRPIQVRIRHRVRAEAVRLELQQSCPAPAAYGAGRGPSCRLYRQDVHPVDRLR